jgi:hypothetical protein
VVFEASDGFARGSDVGGEFCFDEIVGASVERGGGKDDVAVVEWSAGMGVPLSAMLEMWPSWKSRRSGVEASLRLKRICSVASVMGACGTRT